MMKTSFFTAKSGTIFLLWAALFSGTTFAQSPSLTKTFSLSSGGNVEVNTAGGGITVEGQSGNQVEVQMFVKKAGKHIASSDDFMDELNEAYEIEIEKRGNTVYASAKRRNKDRNWNNISISFHVKAPHRVSASLHTSGGSISVSALEGKTKAFTSGGSINVSEQEGDMELNTSGGTISVTNAQGDINGHTSGGSIQLKNIDGRVEVYTSGGSIGISGKANYVKASTSGGSISVNVDEIDEGIYLSTSGGSISANIPGTKGMDLDLKANRINMEMRNFSGQKDKGKVVGTMNGGGVPVHMRTSGGNIAITY